MSYADTLAAKVRLIAQENGFDVIFGGGIHELPFPLDKTFVLISVKKDCQEFLLGAENPVVIEMICFTVLSAETSGAAVCLDASQRLCNGIIDSDNEKMITGISSAGCSFNKELLCYETQVSVGIRAQMRR